MTAVQVSAQQQCQWSFCELLPVPPEIEDGHVTAARPSSYIASAHDNINYCMKSFVSFLKCSQLFCVGISTDGGILKVTFFHASNLDGLFVLENHS